MERTVSEYFLEHVKFDTKGPSWGSSCHPFAFTIGHLLIVLVRLHDLPGLQPPLGSLRASALRASISSLSQGDFFVKLSENVEITRYEKFTAS